MDNNSTSNSNAARIIHFALYFEIPVYLYLGFWALLAGLPALMGDGWERDVPLVFAPPLAFILHIMAIDAAEKGQQTSAFNCWYASLGVIIVGVVLISITQY